MPKDEYVKRVVEGRTLSQDPKAKSVPERRDVRMYGNTAIVTTLNKRTAGDQTLRFASTAVWVKQNGVWQLASVHSHAIPETDPVKR